MHFWINKPAGRNYASGGRRYPTASSASKTRSGRRGREIGPMVTPVHRFQSLNSPSVPVHSNCAPGPSATTRSHHHHQHHQQQQHHHPHLQQQQQSELSRPQSQQQLPPVSESIPVHVDGGTRNTNDDCGNPVFRASSTDVIISNNVTNAAAVAAAAAAGGGVGINHERQILPNETMNNGLNRAGFLDFSEISDTELAGYRLRCGVWITFVLATGFVSVAKFYFGNRDAGLDMLIFCGLLFTLLLSGCFYSTLFRRAQNNQRHLEHLEHLEQEEQQIATLAAALTIREENSQHVMQQQLNLRLQQQQLNLQIQIQQQQQPPPPPPPPPPPYHIAILIPPPNSPEEAPPPSYDKAMNENPCKHTRVFIFSKGDDN